MVTIPKPTFILTDIEGTTTSISFVTEVLFPYFRTNIDRLLNLKSHKNVAEAIQQTKELALSEENQVLNTENEVLEKWKQWSLEDRKVTPLKTVQGVLWDEGYKDGTLKGHVFDDVADSLKKWKNIGIQMGVFSSGSVAAQKLIFGYSIAGDLTPYFSAYFDTTTGGKRDTETYQKIADSLQVKPQEIVFLSDIQQELEAASNAHFQTIQLCREGAVATWPLAVNNFQEIHFK